MYRESKIRSKFFRFPENHWALSPKRLKKKEKKKKERKLGIDLGLQKRAHAHVLKIKSSPINSQLDD